MVENIFRLVGCAILFIVLYFLIFTVIDYNISDNFLGWRPLSEVLIQIFISIAVSSYASYKLYTHARDRERQ